MTGSIKQLCRALGSWPQGSEDPVMECISVAFLKIGLSGVYVLLSISVLVLASLYYVWSLSVNKEQGSDEENQPIHAPAFSYSGSLAGVTYSDSSTTESTFNNKKFITTTQSHNYRLIFWTGLQVGLLLFRLITLYFYTSPTTASAWEPLLSLLFWLYANLLTVLNGELTFLLHLRGFYLIAFLADCFRLRTFLIIETPAAPYPLELGLNAGICIIDLILVLYSLLLTPRLNEINRLASHSPIYPCPERFESLLSIATFSWVIPLLRYGYHKAIEPEDIWDLRPDEKAEFLCSGFSRYSFKGTFGWRVFMFFRIDLLRQVFFSLISLAFGLATPVLLHEFLLLIENPERAGPTRFSVTEYGVYVILALFVAGLVKSCSDSQSLFYGRRVGIRIKAIIMGEVYAKTLRRKDQTSLKDDPSISNAGKITNFLSVDAHEVAETFCYLNYVYTVPLQIGITTWYLYVILGWSAIVGLALTAIIMPINYLIARKWEKVQERLMACSDKRMDIINELLQGIRIIKFFAWEKQFQDRIYEARSAELRVLTQRMFFWVGGATLWYCFPMFITVGTFYTYTKLAGNSLTPTIAFTSILIFKALREPVDQLPELINMFLQAKVSLRRIDAFLQEAESEKFSILRSSTQPEDPILGFNKATLRWDSLEGRPQFSLKNLTITFPPNQLSLVVGPTGSGKSSLLLGLLGEMKLVSGRVYLPRRDVIGRGFSLNGGVAYVAQNAWLQQDTIRNNILFGEIYDEQRYRNTIRACALLPDFQALQGGDLTEIGEKGLTLSGGQKQRVAIARAVYSRATHIILDDCLSAVDAHTAKYLFDNCIMGKLLRGRTRILVTHNVSLAFHHAAHIVVLDSKGNVIGNGSRKEIEADATLKAELAYFERSADIEVGAAMEVDDHTPVQQAKLAPKLVEDEERATGFVGLSIYRSYINAAGGGWYWFGLVALFTLFQSIPVILDWWVKIWASAGTSKDTLHHLYIAGVKPLSLVHLARRAVPIASSDQLDYYIGVYALISLFSIILIIVRVSYQFWGSMQASKRLHTDLLGNILRAPMRFFDTTPVGRLVNRFSKDLQCLDQELMPSLGVVLTESLASLAILGMLMVVLPQFILATIVIVFVYHRVMQFYIRGSREMKRIESITRSPIYAHCGETINGVTTIRAFEQDTRFLSISHVKIDHNLRCFFYLWAANRWLQINSDLTGSLVTLATGMMLLLFRHLLSPALIGLALSYALNFSSHILWIARYCSTVEMNMNSVERIQEYLQVPSEPAPVVESYRPPTCWPTHGQITIRNLVVRYAADRDPVIKGISLDIRPGEKVGLVGRTGAGKSTLALAFFRFVDAEEGSIVIDGMDIYRMGLKDLRSNLTIIPQEAVLFLGTIRSNLDPFDQHTDDRLWNALRRVHIVGDSDDVISSLDQPVTENGQNFSQGQRQLLSLARALLRQSRVIIMDEATASVDYATDTNIQTTIRQEFSHCTLICIAHRLRTIVDYDRIVVMDHGSVKEFDSPAALLANPDGIFRSMCQESGDLETLLQMASKTF
ncbi:Transporter of the ATP-binding cassette (ABC) [Entomophthora muscae]|uniref:Transporter of the ATP-binding cassette (ABC) n=2 Tax=Entomophthora muscae TaxID=34485 RepID=A0ACC2U7A4_9FUNG|nr:Transporter of the ATP-binding cassette (ABC) [Entomophthora muscae]